MLAYMKVSPVCTVCMLVCLQHTYANKIHIKFADKSRAYLHPTLHTVMEVMTVMSKFLVVTTAVF